MFRCALSWTLCLLAAGCSAGLTGTQAARDRTAAGAAAEPSPSRRSFEFRYAGAIEELSPGALARMWIPVARTDAHQDVEFVSIDVPGSYELTTEARYGNRLAYVVAHADDEGRIPFELLYRVTRREARPATGNAVTAEERARFLQANDRVPVGGESVQRVLHGELPDGSDEAVARRLYDAVNAHVSYDKPAGGGWGQGDVAFVCDAGYGNCSDFHSLFISLSRAAERAARFEIGFPLPPEGSQGSIGGYHCWAWVEVDGRWLPVDISEADKHPELEEYYFGHLTPDRVAFTTGRDLLLQPPQNGGPVNFLVYPYVEVDGAPAGTLAKGFSFQDL